MYKKQTVALKHHTALSPKIAPQSNEFKPSALVLNQYISSDNNISDISPLIELPTGLETLKLGLGVFNYLDSGKSTL